MKRDARASFEMHANHQLEYFEEQGYCTMSYESVIGTGKMHIIDNPDLPYPDCNFVLGDIDLPVYNHGSLVHYPNYRLGPLEGSPCDTLGSMSSTFDPEINHQTFRIYPNPAISVLRLELDAYLNHTQEIKIRVMHPTGQLVYSGTLPPYAYMHDIAVHEWSSGLYLVQLLRSDGQELGVEKLIVE